MRDISSLKLILGFSTAAVVLLLSGCAPSTPAETAQAQSAAPQSATQAATPSATPMVTATPDAKYETDAYGVRFWNSESDRSAVTYEEGALGMTVADQQLYVEEKFLISQCMREKGIDYRFRLPWQLHPDDKSEANEHFGETELFALYGEPATSETTTTVPYDWTQRGCTGFVEHEMGQDGTV